MLQYNVKIGLAPMRRDVTPRPGIFNWEKRKNAVIGLLPIFESILPTIR